MSGGKDSSKPPVHPYAGRWIARIGNQILAHGYFPEQVKSAARQNRHKETPTLAYIPAEEIMSFPTVLYSLQALFADTDGIYLVGGAVRDALLNKPVHDLDFVCSRTTRAIAREAANHLGGAFYCMDEERETFRVVLPKQTDCPILDFMAMRGGSLQADLGLRDFTLNALAVDLQDPQKLIDPLKGAQSLREKKLIACSHESFQADPVRILRGIRLAAEGGYTIEPSTRKWMKEAVQGLSTTSVERKREDLFRMLDHPKASTCLRALDWLGVFPFLIPELTSTLQEFGKENWETGLAGIERWYALLDLISNEYPSDGAGDLLLGLAVLKLGGFRGELHGHLATRIDPERGRKGLTIFARLLSMIAKVLSQEEYPARCSREFHLSKVEVQWIERFCNTTNTAIGLIYYGQPTDPIHIYRFFKAAGSAGVDLILSLLADELISQRSSPSVERWEQVLERARELLDHYWHHPEITNPTAFLSGDDLIWDFHLQPGPAIGDLIERLREEQVAGRITGKEEALSWIKSKLPE